MFERKWESVIRLCSVNGWVVEEIQIDDSIELYLNSRLFSFSFRFGMAR